MPATVRALDRLEEAAHWLRSDGLQVDRVYLRYTVCDSTTSICWQECAYVDDKQQARTASVRRLKRQQAGRSVQVLCVESWAGWRDR